MENSEKFKPFDQVSGSSRELYLCSPGKKVVIREITGEDEDILTLMRDQEDGTAISKFVAKVIVSPQTTVDQINKWRVRDKYLILFEAFRLTYGDVFKFEYTFDSGDQFEFEENLEKYIWDFSNKGMESYPGRGDSKFFSERLTPYMDNNDKVEFKLSSGKIVGFEYLTGELESASLMVDQNQRSINDELRDRNFYIKQDAVYHRIDNFRVLGAREMAEIRKKIQEVDPPWPALITLENPKNRKVEKVSIFRIPDFFFRRLF